MQHKQCFRGEIYYADLSPAIGSEQCGLRPVLIIQNNVGNRFSPSVIVAAITSRQTKAKIPTHVRVDMEAGLCRNSYILLEQIRTLDKTRLQEYVGTLAEETTRQVNAALTISIGDYPSERREIHES